MLLISPNLLQLWDLGLARTNPKCLASTERQRFPDEESFEGFRVGPVSQPQMWGDELTFVLNVKTHVPSSYIYTINPNINDGTFKCLARFSLNILRPRLWHFNENFLVYSHKNPRGILIYYWKENISLQWFPSWKSFVEVSGRFSDTQTIAARASSTYDIDFYTIPQLSDYPLAKPGQITTIDNPTIYFSSFKKDFDAPHGHGVALRWVIPSTQVTRPFALHNGIQLPWEIIAKTMSGDFYIGEQNMEVYWAKMNAEDEHEICGWRTTIGRMRIVPAGNLLVDKFDQPASIEFPDGWRLLWWEDNDTESTVRYHLMDFASPEVCSPTWQGVIAHAQVKDGETKGPFPYYKYSFSLMGRTCFVGADGRGFRIVDYCT
ncbi:hypothetical protein DL96DRAFT_16884 [Flagelloscypha sp. PMI_526]|nr:hypothetical protein DL96DRAFT_16884 [Flagelloscypha sp. PMI_526]